MSNKIPKDKDAKVGRISKLEDEKHMKRALSLAKEAYRLGEVPVGAVLVENGSILAEGHNQVQTKKRAVAHAELLVLEKGFSEKGKKYLPDATLYVTLEPCPMCAMSCSWSQIGRIVYAAGDPKRGYSLWKPNLLFPKIEVVSGIYAEESSCLLQSFFQGLRKNSCE